MNLNEKKQDNKEKISIIIVILLLIIIIALDVKLQNINLCQRYSYKKNKVINIVS